MENETNNLLVTQTQSKKEGASIAMMILLAIIASPIVIPVVFALGVVFLTLLTTGFALLIKSFVFLFGLNMVFFIKSFIGGICLLSMSLAPIAIILLLMNKKLLKKGVSS